MSEDPASNHMPLPPKKQGMARLIAATRFSFAGLSATWRNEEAFRLEVFVSIVLAPIGIWLGESRVEQVLLVGCLFLVLLVELLNSAIEAVVDRAGQEFHELAGRAKDTGSAAVFVAMVLGFFVWGMILL